MSQETNGTQESALDRAGPVVVWIGLVIVVVVAMGVMIEGQSSYHDPVVPVAAASTP